MQDSDDPGAPTRDHGLVRGIGAGALALAILNEVIGAGIYTLPAQLAATGGARAVWAYLLCAAAMAAIVLCFAEAGSRVPTSGGPYGYVSEALGPLAGFTTGLLVWLSSVLACGGIAAAVVDGGLAIAGTGGAGWLRPVLILLLIGGMVWLNIAGVRVAARAIGAGLLVKLVPLLLFVLVGGFAVLWRGPVALPAVSEATGLGRGLILVMFAFSGMETALGVSGEVSEPARNVPRALIAAMGAVLLLYVLIQLVAGGLLGPALPASKAPLADAIGLVDVRLRPVLIGGLLLSTLIWLGTDIFGAPRTLFAFGRDRLLPAVLGRLHPRYHTPHVAILVHGAIGAGLAVSGGFVQLAILSSLAIAPVYAMACVAAWRLRRREVEQAGTPFRAPGLKLAAGLGVVSMAALVLSARPAEMAGLVTTLIAAALIHVAATRRLRRG